MRGLAVLYIDKGQLKWSMGTGLIHPLDICMMYNLGDLNDPSIRKIKEIEKKILGMLSLIEREIHTAAAFNLMTDVRNGGVKVTSSFLY